MALIECFSLAIVVIIVVIAFIFFALFSVYLFRCIWKRTHSAKFEVQKRKSFSEREPLNGDGQLDCFNTCFDVGNITKKQLAQNNNYDGTLVWGSIHSTKLATLLFLTIYSYSCLPLSGTTLRHDHPTHHHHHHRDCKQSPPTISFSMNTGTSQPFSSFHTTAHLLIFTTCLSWPPFWVIISL